MQKLLAGSLILAGLSIPAIAQAQTPKHEFGVDMGIIYSKPSGGSGTFGILAPIGDIRIGFLTAGSMMIEPRFAFSFFSGGGTFINVDPGVNLLFKMGQGTGMNHMMGPYLTVGGDVRIVSNKVTGNPTTSGAVFTINGGIGSRMAWGADAKRVEAFVAYTLKSTKLGVPNTLSVGARLGLSLFH